MAYKRRSVSKVRNPEALWLKSIIGGKTIRTKSGLYQVIKQAKI